MGPTANVSDCTPQTEFNTAFRIATTGRIPISEGLQAAFSKGKFQPDNRNGCDKYNGSDSDEWFLGFNEKGNDVYMKQCKVLIEPTAVSKDMKKCLKTDKKVVHVEREEVRYPEIEMMVRKRCPKEVNKLVMRLFYQSDPTRRGHRN